MTWRFAAAPALDVAGRFWRMLAPRWAFDPLSGAGAARAGGRWNAPGQKALYLSNGHATAIAEYQQDLPRPGTLTAYDVMAFRILDLTDEKVRQVLSLQEGFLGQAWKRTRDIEKMRPPGWGFAVAAMEAGWHGIRTRSVQANGTNLVLWRWNGRNEPVVRYLDPLADLPADQASWTQ